MDDGVGEKNCRTKMHQTGTIVQWREDRLSSGAIPAIDNLVSGYNQTNFNGLQVDRHVG
jgi:hypothetical protein